MEGWQVIMALRAPA